MASKGVTGFFKRATEFDSRLKKFKRPMKKFAVFGNPIAHSVSPTIHQMFAKSCGETIGYEKVLVPLDNFEQALTTFFSDPLAIGCNVTVPFKQQAFKLAWENSSAASAAQAVNTLSKDSLGNIQGYNTDGVGLVRDLIAHGTELKNKRILLIGAGGAARGAIMPLIDESPASIAVFNRTFSNAEEMVGSLSHDLLTVVDKESVNDFAADIVINSTSASLSSALPEGVSPALFTRCELAYDMAYGKSRTVFMEYAQQHGAKMQLDGLGMLVEQAAAAFTIWTGKSPDTAPVIQYLRGNT